MELDLFPLPLEKKREENKNIHTLEFPGSLEIRDLALSLLWLRPLLWHKFEPRLGTSACLEHCQNNNSSNKNKTKQKNPSRMKYLKTIALAVKCTQGTKVSTWSQRVTGW